MPYKLIILWGPALLGGALNTLALLGPAALLTFALCILIGLARLSRHGIIRFVATVYVEIFRGVSLYVTLFWIYFALPFLGVQLSACYAAILAIGLVHGAYASEYVRSTILSVRRAQIEAATALSMRRSQTLRYIVFPQAFAMMMPLLGNELVLLLKATSVASLISVTELTEEGHSIVLMTYQTVPTLISVLLLYFIMAQSLLWIVKRVERRVSRWRSVQELERSRAKGAGFGFRRLGFGI